MRETRVYREIVPGGGEFSCPTPWNGVIWESRHEARWMRLVEAIGFEARAGCVVPVRGVGDRRRYTLDGWLPDLGWHVEVKPNALSCEEATLVAQAVEVTSRPVLLLDGPPGHRCYALIHGPWTGQDGMWPRKYLDVREGEERLLACTFRYPWTRFGAIPDTCLNAQGRRLLGHLWLSDTAALAAEPGMLLRRVDVGRDEARLRALVKEGVERFFRPFGAKS